MYRYTVRCEFTKSDASVIDRWLKWLRDPHIADVMEGGATGAEIVRVAGDPPAFEVRYRFASHAGFRIYETEHAPALKQEGLLLFPAEELGMVYSRSHGPVVHATNS